MLMAMPSLMPRWPSRVTGRASSGGGGAEGGLAPAFRRNKAVGGTRMGLSMGRTAIAVVGFGITLPAALGCG